MKVSYVTLIAPLLAALAIAAPAQTYPGCDAATNAAAIGDTTALNNAVKACKYFTIIMYEESMASQYKGSHHHRHLSCNHLIAS